MCFIVDAEDSEIYPAINRTVCYLYLLYSSFWQNNNALHSQLFENLKHTQVEKYNKAKTDEERREVECNPIVVFKQAVENCKPLLLSKRTVKGGIAYRVGIGLNKSLVSCISFIECCSQL